MRLDELDKILRVMLDIGKYDGIDSALNGIQVGNPDAEIKKIAFGVDASMESFRRARECDAQLVFVHHGIFWGKQKPVSGNHFHRIKYLIDNNLSLYAVHLPLDSHPIYGNNIGIARRLGLKDTAPFGSFRGTKIGIKGTLPEPKSIDEIATSICLTRQCCLGVLPFGKEAITSIGIVSGSDWAPGLEAIEENLDCYVTGASAHEIYHDALEAGLNVIFGGHYYTEIFGVGLVAAKIKETTGLEISVLEIPTGL